MNAARDNASPDRTGAGASPAGLRVLVVEDESVISLMIEEMLEELGCVVVGIAAGVREGMELLDRVRPGVAVLDVNLRGEKVDPLAERLETEGVPFLFATGYGRAGIQPRWSLRPVIQKPFHLETLAAALVAATAGDRAIG
jgi:CheY-like chemotaxis protein